jgi:hypothetical protein
MKKRNINIIIGILAIVLLPALSFAQDSTKKELLLSVTYNMQANKVPQLMVNTKTKVEKRFMPAKGIKVNVFLDADSAANLLGCVTTNENGQALLAIPASFKSVWDASASHSFIGKSEANKDFNETKSEITIKKGRLLIDSVVGADARSVEITVLALNGNEWLPVKDAEVKIGVKRLGGILPISDEESYTTDSTGKLVAEFKRDSLPGDSKGKITLVARIEENEELGSLTAETNLPWGIAIKQIDHFNERSLWATRDKAPIWLLFMASSIIIGVWAVLLYLFVQLYRVSRLTKVDEG